MHLAYLFIINYITVLFFSNGRRPTNMGVSINDLTIRSTASAAIRICAGVRRKIASSLLCTAKETSILQRYPRGGHASD